MHTYFNSDKTCGQCGFFTETVSHILNGCRTMKTLYQKRHNRIVDMLFEKVRCMKNVKENCEVLKDCHVKPNMFDNETTTDNFTTTATRPDIVIINKDEKTAFIIEISTPYDAFMDKCYNGKFNKYFPLSLEINTLGYQTKIIVLIIGSLGHVHIKFTNGLKLIGFSNYESKFLAKYYSTSVIIGSYKIWKERCRKTDYVIQE